MRQTTCTLGICGRKHHAQGYCKTHYLRWRRHGDPLFVIAPIDRFWRQVDRSSAEGCWEWQGSRTPNGYGLFKADGRRTVAHRWLYQHLNGPLGADIDVRHRCDNRPCVRPDHLIHGTRADNMADAVERNRIARGERHGSRTHPESRRNGALTKPEKVARGEAHGHARLTEDRVREIRRRYASGEKQTAIALSMGETVSLIGKIVRRTRWGHVSD